MPPPQTLQPKINSTFLCIAQRQQQSIEAASGSAEPGSKNEGENMDFYFKSTSYNTKSDSRSQTVLMMHFWPKSLCVLPPADGNGHWHCWGCTLQTFPLPRVQFEIWALRYDFINIIIIMMLKNIVVLGSLWVSLTAGCASLFTNLTSVQLVSTVHKVAQCEWTEAVLDF